MTQEYLKKLSYQKLNQAVMFDDIHSLSSLIKRVDLEKIKNNRVKIVGGGSHFSSLAIQSLVHNFSLKKAKTTCPLLIILPSEKSASKLHSMIIDNLINNLKDKVHISLYLQSKYWGAKRADNHHNRLKANLLTLYNLYKSDKNSVIITTITALSQFTPPPSTFKAAILSLTVDDEYDFDHLESSLEKIGYQNVSDVDKQGTFTIRGFIVDIFPINLKQPIRLEFFANNLGAIHSYNISTQLSQKQLHSIDIIPATDCLISERDVKDISQDIYTHLLETNISKYDINGTLHSFNSNYSFTHMEMFISKFYTLKSNLTKYLQPNFYSIYPESINVCTTSYVEFFEEAKKSHQEDLNSKIPSISYEEVYEKNLDLSTLSSNHIEFDFDTSTVDTFKILQYSNKHQHSDYINWSQIQNKSPESLLEFLDSSQTNVMVVGRHCTNYESFISLCTNHGIKVISDQLAFSKYIELNRLTAAKLTLSKGSIESSYYDFEQNILLISEDEIWKKSKKIRKNSEILSDQLTSFEDLKVNDLVVHEKHGIGQYMGLQQIKISANTYEFIHVQYDKNDKIYLPINRINFLQKYRSQGQAKVKLDRIGSSSWERKTSKAKKNIEELATQLIDNHARRKVAKGHQYQAPCQDYIAFERDFPFAETEDQLNALADIEKDLLSQHAMNRIVIGDVGFGKTEVAIRACYRAILEGFQVAVIVPTTVLCYQHVQHFKKRLEKFGVEISFLNRFVTASQKAATVEGFAQGRIDLLIGTHSLLSKHLVAKNLGLIVLDEEQRFGVSHKEKLAKFGDGVDYLYLTATPIPRTLHMAMVGLQDISIIMTPPANRLPVTTHVRDYSETILKDAIAYELKRGGQIFVVNNSIEELDSTAKTIQNLLPSASIAIVHGQQKAVDLERRLLEFIEKKFSILICTTIIESGVDIPNVNTLIVLKSENYGLSQLHQLRGRVGRSSVQSYAYLFTRQKRQQLSDEACRRLDAIVSNQNLGSGFMISTQDLEQRGAGNLIGREQSGHISDVGLELYTQMLNEAVSKLKGQQLPQKTEPEIKLQVDAFIDKNYIIRTQERLILYKQLFSSKDHQEIDQVTSVVNDKYGPPPATFYALTEIAKLKIEFYKLNVSKIRQLSALSYELSFGSLEERMIATIYHLVSLEPKNYNVTPDFKLIINCLVQKEDSTQAQLEQLRSRLSKIITFNEEPHV